MFDSVDVVLMVVVGIVGFFWTQQARKVLKKNLRQWFFWLGPLGFLGTSDHYVVGIGIVNVLIVWLLLLAL